MTWQCVRMSEYRWHKVFHGKQCMHESSQVKSSHSKSSQAWHDMKMCQNVRGWRKMRVSGCAVHVCAWVKLNQAKSSMMMCQCVTTEWQTVRQRRSSVCRACMCMYQLKSSQACMTWHVMIMCHNCHLKVCV